MKKYRVWAHTGDYAYIDIEAETEDEALEAAELVDGGDYTISSGLSGYFEIDDIEELTGNSG